MSAGCYDRCTTVSPNVLPRMSVADYLADEHSQEVRHEFVDGSIEFGSRVLDRHD